MKSANKYSSLYADDADFRPRNRLKTLNDLDDLAVPTPVTSFNTCTRSGEERRQAHDRRRAIRAASAERRSGRDRRIMSHY